MIAKVPVWASLFALLLSAGCGSSKKTAEVQEPPKPEWVTNRPVDPNYYIGIGIASKAQFPNTFAAEAKKFALNELASEIKVNVSSNSMLFSVEDASGEFRDEFKSFTQVRSNADVQNFEQVDVYESSTSYWVFYRLSKAQYQQDKAANIERAIDASKGFFQQAQALEKQGDYKRSLVNYFKSIEPLKPYLGEPLQTEYDGASVYWGNTVVQQVGLLADRMTLQAVQTPVARKWGQELGPESLRFRLMDSRGSAVVGVPVVFRYSEGFIRPKFAMTDAQGQASGNIPKIKQKKATQRVWAKVDFGRMYREQAEKKDAVLEGLLERFQAPEAELVVQVSAPTVYVRSAESMNGKKGQGTMLLEASKSEFAQQGYLVVDRVSQADLRVVIEVNAQDGEERFDMQTAFLDGTFTVSDSRAQVIFSYTFDRVRGAQLSPEAARTNALQKAAQEIEDRVVPRFNRNYLK